MLVRCASLPQKLKLTATQICGNVDHIASLLAFGALEAGGGDPIVPGPDPILAVESVMRPLLKSYLERETCVVGW